MFDSEDRGLTHKDLTDQRNDAMREGVKALVLMNGGGAVALLAFLQAIWEKDATLASWIIGGVACLVLGVGCAGLVHLFRVHTSNAFNETWVLAKLRTAIAQQKMDGVERRMRRFQFLYFACAYASLILFLVGVGVVVYGAAVSPPPVRLQLPGY